MPEPLRVAVVGGGIGRSHIEAFGKLPEQFDVVAICDLDLAKARLLAEEHAIARVTAELDELCRMDELDIIDICTPPHLHFRQIEQVLAAGKHAFCEKPLVGSLAEVDRLAEAEVRSGRRVMPIFQKRFGRGLQKLRFLVDHGLAGRAYVATAETAWRRRAEYYAVPWRGKWSTELGGTLLGHAIHAHDMLSYILGPISRVFARVATRVNPIEVEDCASVSLLMADGSLASLTATLGSSPEITRHRFCFSNLTAESNLTPYNNSSEPWTFTADTPEQASEIDAALAQFRPLPESFEGQFLRAYNAMHSGDELPVTLADARTALELVSAMYYGARSGEDVALPLGRDHPVYGGWLPEA